MESNPYKSPRELGTKPTPEKWDAQSMLFAVLALISVIFGVLAGGYFLFLDKLWLSITMMTTGIVPSTFFTVMLYRYRQGWLGLAAAILAVAVAIICIIAFAGTLIAMLYLNEPL